MAGQVALGKSPITFNTVRSVSARNTSMMMYKFIRIPPIHAQSISPRASLFQRGLRSPIMYGKNSSPFAPGGEAAISLSFM